MKKLFLILMAVALAMVALTAGAEGSTEATNERIEKDEFGNEVIIEDVDLDAEELEKEDLYTEDDGDYPIPLEEDEETYEESDDEFDEEGPEPELEWITEEDEKPEEEPEPELTYIDMSSEEKDLVSVPVLLCVITAESVQERKGPSLEAEVVTKHHKDEVVPVVDISNEDWWLLENGNYINADYLMVKDDNEVPGRIEETLGFNLEQALDVQLMVAGIARDENDLVDEFHSVIIYNVGEERVKVYKYGIETLEVDVSGKNSLSQLYRYWTITEEFTEEDAVAFSLREVMELIYRYSLPGSYVVIFP